MVIIGKEPDRDNLHPTGQHLVIFKKKTFI